MCLSGGTTMELSLNKDNNYSVSTFHPESFYGKSIANIK